MAAPVQPRFDELVRAHVWPRLQQAGSRRSKASFHRPVGANWEVVNLQKSAYSDRSHISFTINIGVAVERLRSGVWDWGEGKRPAVNRCRFERRIGRLLRGEDVWWDLTQDTDLGELGDALCETIERYALPWLRARSTDEALRETMLAELHTAYDHELTFLAELLEQIGPATALDAVRRELGRRGERT